MDLDSFSQCIQYIQSNRVGFSYDKLIPVASALIGSVIGFKLNQYSGEKKDRRVIENKVVVCKEEVEELQNSAKEIALETCDIFKHIVTFRSFDLHHLPPSVNSMFLDKCFVDVSHEFSSNQRKVITQLLITVRSINKAIESVKGSGSLFEFSINVLDLSNKSIVAWGLCNDFINDNCTELTEVDALSNMLATEDQLAAHKIIKDNAISGNLNLGIN